MIQTILSLLFNILYFLILARIIISFVRPDPYGQFGEIARIIHNITEPILAPFRQILPPMGGLDFSPILLFLLIGFAQRLLLSF